MKIPLNIKEWAGGKRIMLYATLMHDDPHIFAPIEFIIDTGSPTTLLGEIDAKRFRISKIQLNKLEGRKSPINIGGGQIQTKVLPNAKIKINDFETSIPIQVVIENEKGNTLATSIIGVDFLEKAKLKLVFDPTKSEAYLESSE